MLEEKKKVMMFLGTKIVSSSYTNTVNCNKLFLDAALVRRCPSKCRCVVILVVDWSNKVERVIGMGS